MNSKLQKHIGTKELLAYYISSVVGAGVLIIPGIAAQIAGPASLVAWVLLAVISAPVAITFAKMAILVPESGGVPAFVERTFDARLGKSMSMLLTVTMIIGNPVMGLASAHYLRDLLGYEAYLIPWVGFGFMLLSIAFNLIGIRVSSKIQTFALLILISGLTAVIILSLPKTDLKNITPFFPYGVASVGSAMVICFYSFLGWENVSSISEEVIQPERAFRQAIPWAIVCVGGLYVLITWVYLTTVPVALRANDPTVLAPILQVVFGKNVSIVGSVVAVILLVLTTNSWVLGASRLVYSLARNNILPAALSKISGRTGVPVHALLFLALGYGLIALIISNTGWSVEWLIKLANANFMLIYFGAFLAALNIFESKRMKACAWLAILTTSSFIPFFGWVILVSLCILGISYVWLLYKSKSEPQERAAEPDGAGASNTRRQLP